MSVHNKKCNPFWQSIVSKIKKSLGLSSKNKIFYVVYPPLENFEDTHPSDWLREEETYLWFHEANAIADKANRHAKRIIAIVCEVEMR